MVVVKLFLHGIILEGLYCPAIQERVELKDLVENSVGVVGVDGLTHCHFFHHKNHPFLLFCLEKVVHDPQLRLSVMVFREEKSVNLVRFVLELLEILLLDIFVEL